jgi:hypothetical protein
MRELTLDQIAEEEKVSVSELRFDPIAGGPIRHAGGSPAQLPGVRLASSGRTALN